jgi:hypothetical protein
MHSSRIGINRVVCVKLLKRITTHCGALSLKNGTIGPLYFERYLPPFPLRIRAYELYAITAQRNQTKLALELQKYTMTDRHISDSGPTGCEAVASKAQSRNSDNPSAAVPQEVDSSTPLPSESPVQNNEGLEYQETSTTLGGDDSPPMTWRERGYVVVTVIAFLALFIAPNALKSTGADPLYFTALTWDSAVLSLLITMLLVS